VRALFSAKKRTFLPALMDGLAVLPFALIAVTIYAAFKKEYGVIDSITPTSPLEIMAMVAIVGLTGGFSWITIRMNRRRNDLPTQRNKRNTWLLIVLAIVTPMIISMAEQANFSFDAAFQSLTLGPTLVPAAIRYTAPRPPHRPSGSTDAMRAFGVQPGPGHHDGPEHFQGWRNTK